MSDQAKLLPIVIPSNMDLIHVAPDGNCFYRSLGKAFDRPWQPLKDMVMSELARLKDDEWEEARAKHQISKYCEHDVLMCTCSCGDVKAYAGLLHTTT